MMQTPSTTKSSSSPSSVRAATPVHGGGELRRALVVLRADLHARALRMSRSSAIAEDLVQDTIERAIRFEAHYIPGTNVRAWVHQILFSVFITRCRRLRRERNALSWLSTDPNAWTVPHADAPMQRLSPAIQRALDKLPEVFRKAVELVDLGELAYKDAADIMGVPVGTVMSRLHRGRKLLAEALRDERDARETPSHAEPLDLAA